MSDCKEFLSDEMKTPIGTAILVADENGALRMLFWEEHAEAWRKAFRRRHGAVAVVPRRDRFGHTAALKRYFEGEIAVLDTIPVAFAGTPFQKKVWSALRSIEAGTTVSYGTLARRIHEPTAARAVGLANGSNPIGVVVPCHRVIGSDGSLTGYGGGLPRKRWLLEHEARHSYSGREISR
jgi:methylated-DNA-[protein]-cysteine S-methyltransferase